MKRTGNIWIRTAILSILLFVIGKLLFARLFGFFEPHIDGIDFRIRELDQFINTSTLFSLMLVLICFVMVFMWKFAPVVAAIRKIISVMIVLLFMSTGIGLRHFQVRNYFIRVVKPYFLSKGQFKVDYPIDPRNFVYYMAAGFCMAFIIAWLFLKQKIKQVSNVAAD
jgi:hypothetical protein